MGLPSNPPGLAAYILLLVALFCTFRFATLVVVASYALHRARQFSDADTWDRLHTINARLSPRIQRWAARISPRPV